MSSTILPPPAPAAPPSWPCPRCGAPLPPMDPAAAGPSVTCSCGHTVYSGYLAEAIALDGRLSWLRDRLVAGDPEPPAEFARRYGVWTTSPATPPDRPAAAVGVQTVLLTLGAVLVIAGAIVFAAVVWQDLGVVGQVLLFTSLTLAVGLLAARLQAALPRSAEALGMVTGGLVVIDAVAAPRLGFLPEEWWAPAHPYLVVVAAVIAAAGITLGRATRLRGWTWSGWVAVGATAGAIAWWLGDLGGTPSLRAAAAAVLTLTGVVLTVGAARFGPDTVPARITGTGALASGALVVAGHAVTAPGVTGAFATTVVTTLALVGAATTSTEPSWRDRFGMAGLIGFGAAAGMTALLPADPQPTGLGLVVGVSGAALLVALAATDRLRNGLVGAGALWGTWIVGRAARATDGVPGVRQAELEALVQRQMTWLALTAAVVGFVLAARRIGGERAPWVAWPAAASGVVALRLADLDWLPELLEAATLPIAAVLLVAGFVGPRSGANPSVARYGPALVVALVPSALATWGAPWVIDRGEEVGTTTHLVRLLVLLVVGTALAWIGARRLLAGVLAPAAAALAITAAAQVWTGLAALPRWIALAAAGTALVAAGARLEWLRDERRRAGTWFRTLS